MAQGGKKVGKRACESKTVIYANVESIKTDLM